MNFDQYWQQLVGRVYRDHAILQGDEERFYRLSCIYGETMVDGIESYFERRYDEFAADMKALRSAGFGELAAEFELASKLLFGSATLDGKTVEATMKRVLDETEGPEHVLKKIGKIYDRIIPQLEQLADYKYSFGLEVGLFSEASDIFIK